jgi:hypothetical protein
MSLSVVDVDLVRSIDAIPVDGRPYRAEIVAARELLRHDPAYFGAIEADLVRWWRTHPNVGVKAFAAEALAKGGLEHASAVLSEGLPGANEARPVSEGEGLDNGHVRDAFVRAAYAVLAGDPRAAFERLSRYFVEADGDPWFVDVRAEVIGVLLMGQAGHGYSTWLSAWCHELHCRGALPDPRWRALRARAHPRFAELLDEIAASLDDVRPVSAAHEVSLRDGGP